MFHFQYNTSTARGLTAATDANYVLVYSGKYFDWYAYQTTWDEYYSYYASQLNYPDMVYDQLVTLLGVNIIQNTPNHRLYLLVNQQVGGGFAAGYISEIGKGPGIGIAYDAWFSQYSGSDNWSTELIAHEETNLFTGNVVGGWPRDWWADDISPFPYAMKIVVEQNLGHFDAANASLNSADALTKMFLNFRSTYGANIYSIMMQMLLSDGWSQWFGPNPSLLLSEYVAAYLSLAAGSNLANQININFLAENISYQLDPNVVQAICNSRQFLQQIPQNDTSWQSFKQGQYTSLVGAPDYTLYAAASDSYAYSMSDNYTKAWTSTSGVVVPYDIVLGLGQSSPSFGVVPAANYEIWRAFLYFDTTSLPTGLSIQRAVVTLYISNLWTDTDFNITLQNGQPTCPHDPTQTVDFDKAKYSGIGGQLSTVGLTEGLNVVALNPTGIGWINSGGWTKFCLRSDRDIDGIPPTNAEHIGILASEYGNGIYRARLNIWARADVATTAVVLSKSIVGQGSSVYVDAEVQNLGDYAKTFNVTAYANSTAIGTELVTLAPNDGTILQFMWNTTTCTRGNYSISAYAWPVPGETNTANNRLTGGTIFVTIQGDANGDRKVNVLDLILVAIRLGIVPYSPQWNGNCDLNSDGTINVLDLIICAIHMGQHW